MFNISAKTAKAVFIVALIFVLVLGVSLFMAVKNYAATPFSMVFEGKEEYVMKNDMLLKANDSGEPDTKAPALYYSVNAGEFNVCEPMTLDLEKFGFSGSIDYYRYVSKTEALFFPMYDLYYRFAPLNSISSMVYEDESGKKYILNPMTQSAIAPTVEKFFARSYDNEDIYGTKMQAVSSTGFTAAGIDDDILYVSYFNGVADSDIEDYRGDRAFSLKDMGFTDCKVKFFINEKHLWFTAVSPEGVRGNYVADTHAGQVAACPEISGAEFTESLMRDYFAIVTQNEENSVNKDTDKYVYAECCNVITGSMRTALMPASDFSSAKIESVSAKAGHMVLECVRTGETEPALYAYSVKAGKQGKYSELSSLIPDGMKIKNTYFVYDNILAITFEDAEGNNAFTNVYKINF